MSLFRKFFQNNHPEVVDEHNKSRRDFLKGGVAIAATAMFAPSALAGVNLNSKKHKYPPWIDGIRDFALRECYKCAYYKSEHIERNDLLSYYRLIAYDKESDLGTFTSDKTGERMLIDPRTKLIEPFYHIFQPKSIIWRKPLEEPTRILPGRSDAEILGDNVIFNGKKDYSYLKVLLRNVYGTESDYSALKSAFHGGKKIFQLEDEMNKIVSIFEQNYDKFDKNSYDPENWYNRCYLSTWSIYQMFVFSASAEFNYIALRDNYIGRLEKLLNISIFNSDFPIIPLHKNSIENRIRAGNSIGKKYYEKAIRKYGRN